MEQVEQNPIHLLPKELQEIVVKAVEIGVEQGIKAAFMKNTSTQPKLRKRISFKEALELSGMSKSSLRRRFEIQPGYEKLYDPSLTKPHNIKGGTALYFWEDEFIKWINQQ